VKNVNDYSELEARILRHEEKKASLATTYGTGRNLGAALTPDQLIELMKTVTRVIKEKAEMATKQPALDQPLQQNSITKLQALVPVRVATSKILEGTWVGPALDEARVVGSLFGGAHYILQLGYNQVVGYAASFRLVFVAHMPVEKGVSLTDPAVIEDAQQTANAFMMMLNLRRTSIPGMTPGGAQTKQTGAGATHVTGFQGSGSAIPGKPLTGKRADVLIVDEVSENHPLVKNKLADARSSDDANFDMDGAERIREAGAIPPKPVV
jgi:hypothetical protein